MDYILVPLDGSPVAEQVVPYVEIMAQALNVPVRLFHVINSAMLQRVPARTTTGATIVAQLEHAAHTYMETITQRLDLAGLKVEPHLERGSAADNVVAHLEQHPGGMVMMATHGQSGLQRWSLGSVTERVVQATTAPVFVVRAMPTAPEQVQLQRVLVPLDGSAFSAQALSVASWVATALGAQVHLFSAIYPVSMHVHQPAPQVTDPRGQAILPSLQQQAEEYLSSVAPQFAGLHVAQHVAIGTAVEAIIDEAARVQADLIVMATHGYTGIRRWALGSVASKVLRATQTPLLLVRVK